MLAQSVCAALVFETRRVTQNMQVNWAMSQGWPCAPGVLRVVGHCASPAPLPTVTDFGVG